MISLGIYSIALIAYLSLGFIQFHNTQNVTASLVTYLLGLIPIIHQIHQKLSIVFIRYYFFWTRIKQKLTNPTCAWQIIGDFRGEFDNDVISKLKDFMLNKALFRRPVKILSESNLTLVFSVSETLHFTMELHKQSHSDSSHSAIGLKLSKIEIGSNSALRKLEKEILPIIDSIQNQIKPATFAYNLNVDFLGANPFYSRYMQHIKGDAIADFRLTLHLDDYTCSSEGEMVEINKDKLHIVAHSLNGLKELARDFLFQSPNLNQQLHSSNA